MAEKTRLYYFSRFGYFLPLIGIFTIVYSYYDRPQNELHYLAQSFSHVADAPARLLHIGIFALIICVINLIGFVYDSLLVQYVIASLILALVTIQVHMAVVVSGYLSDNGIDFMLKVKELTDETGDVGHSKNRVLREQLEMTLDCCGSSNGFSWLIGPAKDETGTCCPLNVRNAATHSCPYQLSKLLPCDLAGHRWVLFRARKFFFISALCAFLEAVCLVLILVIKFPVTIR